MNEIIPKERQESGAMSLPPAGLHVLVQCEGFRCLAYRTLDGKWKDAYNHRELPNILRVISLEADV